MKKEMFSTGFCFLKGHTISTEQGPNKQHGSVDCYSLVIILFSDYLNALSNGQHEISVIMNDAYVTSRFELVNKKDDIRPSYILPVTGID
ncbi:MAG: hypothetical protein J6S49_08495 [Erysipelotrichaceae bacterium]|nr:hypothetical protein [Erysipelotrichaceae bacterium]